MTTPQRLAEIQARLDAAVIACRCDLPSCGVCEAERLLARFGPGDLRWLLAQVAALAQQLEETGALSLKVQTDYAHQSIRMEQGQDRLRRCEAALRQFVQSYRVLYNVEQITPLSYDQHQRLDRQLREAYDHAAAALPPEGR